MEHCLRGVREPALPAAGRRGRRGPDGPRLLQLRDAPVDVLPEFTPPYAEIQTEALGLSADEVEQLITVPLEADLLNGVEGVEVIRSQSLPGLSSIVHGLRAGHRHLPRPPARRGAPHAGARAAQRVEAAHPAAAAVLLQPAC